MFLEDDVILHTEMGNIIIQIHILRHHVDSYQLQQPKHKISINTISILNNISLTDSSQNTENATFLEAVLVIASSVSSCTYVLLIRFANNGSTESISSNFAFLTNIELLYKQSLW